MPSKPSNTVLVTGGSRGIGHAIAAMFGERGWRVLAPTRGECDLADPGAVDTYCARLSTATVDALVNNAGVNPIAPLASITVEQWRDVQQVNVGAPLRLMQCLLPAMAGRGWGRVVNIASVWSFRAREGRANYAASKAALAQLTRVAALEFGPSNVLVNALAPGFVDTDLTRRNNSPEAIEEIRIRIPLRRLADPTDIARAVYWLCSDDNRYVTGQLIVADGGISIQ